MPRRFRPAGRDRIFVHLEADHPQADLLAASAIFKARYLKAGKVVAFDFCFPAASGARLRQMFSVPPRGGVALED